MASFDSVYNRMNVKLDGEELSNDYKKWVKNKGYSRWNCVDTLAKYVDECHDSNYIVAYVIQQNLNIIY